MGELYDCRNLSLVLGLVGSFLPHGLQGDCSPPTGDDELMTSIAAEIQLGAMTLPSAPSM